MPKPRNPENVALPRNLYRHGTNFRYKHPVTRKRFLLPGPEREAIKAAIELNDKLTPTPPTAADVVAQILISERQRTKGTRQRAAKGGRS